MYTYDLRNNWHIRSEELHWGTEHRDKVAAREDGWLAADLPCDIHMALIAHSVIKEPLEAVNSLESEWTEQKSWWFRNTFAVDDRLLEHERIELTFDTLDAEADVFLNGRHLGHHRSAYYPFVQEVKPLLRKGDNELLVRLTSGLERYSEADMAQFKSSIGLLELNARGDQRRGLVRKPAYVYGWDWGPRVATCGIVGGARLTGHGRAAIRSVRAHTVELRGDVRQGSVQAQIALEAEIENFHPFETLEAVAHFQVLDGERPVMEWREEVSLRSGIDYVDVSGSLEQAKLWWPNGMGAPSRYTVRMTLTAEADGITVAYPPFQFGIRTIRIDQSRLGKGERLFAIEINGVRTFCKGGNWIPADSIYARVTEQKYETLIAEAQEANFNMLRIWGGGIYEHDAFYEQCDARGIMIWHDFMFSCAMYPDELEWFRDEVEREIDYQTKRLRNHPSIVLWCGNNENTWGFDEWWPQLTKEGYFGGARCYNEIAPRAVRRNCPDIPYWNSSPYGGAHPNGSAMGDRHHWHDCTMHPEMEKRITPEEYDKVTAKFVSEYGYIGPCRLSTIERYHGGERIDRTGIIWHNHNNTFEKDTVPAGITKHYTDAAALDLNDYLLYAGLCQGLMYGYSLEALRYKDFCSGALFWMYNDCWGEVGWTIVDYYLKRKTSYYYVKRAFAPVKLILRENDGIIAVVGINETAEAAELEVEYGYAAYDGSSRLTERTKLALPAYSRQIVMSFAAPQDVDRKRGAIFVRPLAGDVQAAVLRSGVFRELHVPESAITVSDFHIVDGNAAFTVSSAGYSHAVHFNLADDLRLSDEYFDLLPGDRRTVVVYGAPAGFSAADVVPMNVNGIPVS